MQIRHFRPGDEPALYRVHFSAVHQIAARDYTPEQCEAWAPKEPDLAAWALRVQGIQPFIVEIDGRIAGYADLQPSGHIDQFCLPPPRLPTGRASRRMTACA